MNFTLFPTFKSVHLLKYTKKKIKSIIFVYCWFVLLNDFGAHMDSNREPTDYKSDVMGFSSLIM